LHRAFIFHPFVCLSVFLFDKGLFVGPTLFGKSLAQFFTLSPPSVIKGDATHKKRLCHLLRSLWASKTGRPGVDVMLTIFCDSCQFLAKKLAVFFKNQCYDHNFCKKTSSSLSKKTPMFSLNFSGKIF
jgi:hypothetical protein